MCGRFGLFARLDAIEDHYDARFTFDYVPRYNIAAEGSGIATIRNETPDKTNQLKRVPLPPGLTTSITSRCLSTQVDTVDEKLAFMDAFANGWVLIPASNFYEWIGRQGSRIPHYTSVEN